MNSGGRLILVAGGTGGLGRAVALAFLGEGARVAVTYRAAAELEALTRAAGEDAVRISGHPTDVTDHEAVRTLVDELVARHGRLDALVNTVGAYAGGAKLWEMDAGTLDRMLLANLRSGYVLARAAVPVMLKQGHGAIVNVASRAALVHGRGRERVRRLQGRGGRADRFTGGGPEGHGGARELDPAEHHRHRGQPQGDAQGRFLEVAEAGGDRPRRALSLRRRREADPRRGHPGLRAELGTHSRSLRAGISRRRARSPGARGWALTSPRRRRS